MIFQSLVMTPLPGKALIKWAIAYLATEYPTVLRHQNHREPRSGYWLAVVSREERALLRV
jgi:hypothetical protein